MPEKVYKKEKSFTTFHSRLGTDIIAQQARVAAVPGRADFSVTAMVADEMSRLEDADLPEYLFHRYRYEMFPVQRLLDDYPPYLQIEPASICNYRCVFCYQVNKAFSDRGSEHMGKMAFALFKEIIDQADGNIEFLSLASRGEPLVCDDIDEMLRYCSGKFLGLKLNTNASLLNEEHCHAVLAGGVNTVVFSLDAADAVQYAKMRVHGVLSKVEQNIRLFERVRKEHYSGSKIISRISGVKFGAGQDIEAMVSSWGDVVDQVCLVNYNPWEDVYAAEPNRLDRPCSDLWRRMFIWFDGKANPCDVDCLSSLSVGFFPAMSIKELWHSQGYEQLRKKHSDLLRHACEPCRRCLLV